MTAAPYTSTATAQQVAARLADCSAAVVTTHTKPDGDAAGSSLAVARALRHLEKKVEVWHVGPFQNWLKVICADTPVRRINPDQPAPSDFEPDVVAITDTGSWVQLEPIAPWLRPRAHKAVIIDHHLHGDADAAPMRLIETNAASATQVAAPVIAAMLGLRDDQPFPRDVAEALYLGLATDTGWFKFSNVTPATMRLAARLLESGVDHPAIYAAIEQQDTPARPLLLGRALAGMTFELGGRVAMMSLTAKDLHAAKGGQEDTGGFTDPAMSVASVRVACVFTDATKVGDATPLTKVSLRSKPGAGAIDVAALAATMGGGGHARAAGIKLKMPLSEAKAKVLAALSDVM